MARTCTYAIQTEEDTRRLAAALAPLLEPGMVVGLTGDLGTGKSVFVRAAAYALGVREKMPSPTYTVVESYHTESATVLHIDLYRLGTAEEFHMLGLDEELAESISFVEWIDRVPELAEGSDVSVSISMVPSAHTERRDSERSVTVRLPAEKELVYG